MSQPDRLSELAGALQTMRDTEAAVDALYRFAAGQDLKDPELFRSAFAEEATLDFTQPARRHGAEVPVMSGRGSIERILDTLAPLITSHTVTNPRVTFHGEQAMLTALVEAMHVVADDPARFLQLKNVYDVTLVRDGTDFVIEQMTIRNLWSRGDAAVLFGPPPPVEPVPSRLDERRWIDLGGGVRLAPLRAEPDGAGTAVLAFDAGARSPTHRHPGGEDLYVLDGRLRVGGRVLEAGDFLHTPPGGVHDAQADAASLVLISVPEPVEFLESA